MLCNPDKTFVQRLLHPLLIVAYWICLIISGLLATLINLSCVLTSLLPQGKWQYGFYQCMLRTMTHGFLGLLKCVGLLKIQHFGFEALPKGSDSVKPILVANHPNLLDIFLFYAELPRLTCIYKSSLEKTLVRFSMGQQIGFISNENPKRMIIEAAERVHAGEQLLIFPEGTRTVTWPLNELKSGAAGIARRADVGLQTVLIHCSSNFLSKNQPIFKPPILPIYTRVEVGEIFYPKDYPSSQALNQAMADYFKQQLKEERTFQ